MINLMDCTVYETLAPGVIALVSQGEGLPAAQILHTRSMAKLLGRLIDELSSNKYKNRTIQEKYNKGELSLMLLEKVDLSGIESIPVKELILRHKAIGHYKDLESKGYAMVSQYLPVRLKIAVEILSPRKVSTPQVVVRIARGTKYYVQLRFDSIPLAEEYIASSSIEEILKATQGSNDPFKVVKVINDFV